MCNVNYSRSTTVAIHASTVHSEMQSHKCEFCEETFGQYMDMRDHLMNNHSLLDKKEIPNDRITYECSKCGQTFLRMEALNLHVLKEYLGHKCYICDKPLDSSASVARHVSSVHFEIQSHKCEFCEETFGQFMEMRHHMMSNHSLLDGKYVPSEKISILFMKDTPNFKKINICIFTIQNFFLI